MVFLVFLNGDYREKLRGRIEYETAGKWNGKEQDSAELLDILIVVQF